MRKIKIDIEEESDNRLTLTRDTRIFSNKTYIISYIISLSCIFIFTVTTIIILYYKSLEYLIISIALQMIFTMCFSTQWNMNKVKKLIIDKKNQKIINYKNYLKPQKVKEYDIESLIAIKLRNIVHGRTWSGETFHKILLSFNTNKLEIFDAHISKEQAILICNKLLKYLSVHFIEERGVGAKKVITQGDFFTDFFYCLY
ncbi:MAG: hypothetical protein ACFFDN_48355, partial [Candidatus Hodarchaeota archaeon]